MQLATCKGTRIMAQERPWMCGAPTLKCQVNLACHSCGYWQAPSIVTSTVLRQAGKYVAYLPNFLLIHIFKLWFFWSCIYITVLILSSLEICKSHRSCRVITLMSTKNQAFPCIHTQFHINLQHWIVAYKTCRVMENLKFCFYILELQDMKALNYEWAQKRHNTLKGMYQHWLNINICR